MRRLPWKAADMILDTGCGPGIGIIGGVAFSVSAMLLDDDTAYDMIRIIG